MARISQRRISQFLQIGEYGTTTTDKGRALEDLVCYLFEKIPGISVTERNRMNVFDTEEIDVAFWNDKDHSGLSFAPNILLVECKNWSAPVSSIEVSWFDTKLRSRGLYFGILIAANGITGNTEQLTAAHSIVAAAQREQRRIVIITREEIESFTNTAQLVMLFKRKLCELAVYGTSIP